MQWQDLCLVSEGDSDRVLVPVGEGQMSIGDQGEVSLPEQLPGGIWAFIAVYRAYIMFSLTIEEFCKLSNVLLINSFSL